MKKIGLFFILFSVKLLVAQEYTVSLQVKNTTDKKPVEFCNVVAVNDKDSVVSSCYTDEKGYAYVPLPAGKYSLILLMTGFETDTIKDIFVNGDKFLDVYKIKPLDAEIEAVTVKGNSKNIEIDKEVQVVTPAMRRGAANTYDVLDKVPGLNYDRYNNQIKVDNDPNIIILVNGMEKDISYIRNLNPDRLLRIEVIRDPAGKYGFEGYSAVINIILKSNYKGYDFTISSMGGFDWYHHSIPPIVFDNNYLNLNYTNRKINFYGGYSSMIANFYIHNFKERIYNDSSKILYNNPDGLFYNMIYKTVYHNFNLGVDYFMTPKQTLSVEADYSLIPLKNSSATNNYIVDETATNTSFVMESLSKSSNNTATAKLFYIGDYNSANKLNISLLATKQQSTNNSYLQIQDNVIKNFTNNDLIYIDFNTEYNHYFTPKTGIVAGMTFISKNNDEKLENNFSQETFNYLDARLNGYFYLSHKFSDKLSSKIGIGYEEAYKAISSPESEKYFHIWQPYADLKYSPIKMLDIKLKYRTKGIYPTVNQLTGNWTSQTDIQIIKQGNPDLTPEITNRLSLSFLVMKGLVSIEPYYEFSDNTIIGTITPNDDGMWVSSYENAANSAKKGIKYNLTLPLGKSIFAQLGGNFFKSQIEYNGETRTLNDNYLNSSFIYQNQKYKIFGGIVFQKQLYHTLTWTGYTSNGNDFWGVLIQKSFFKEKFSLMMIYVLPVNWLVDYNQGAYSFTNEYKEFNNVDVSVLKNLVIFQISYRFNKGHEIRKIDKKEDIELDTKPKSFF